MSDTPNETMVVIIDYGDGSDPEEHVVTAGYFHFHPAVDEEKHLPTITLKDDAGDDDDDEEDREPTDEETERDQTLMAQGLDTEIQDADVVEDDAEQPEQSSAPAGFDPSAHNVQDVKDYVTSNPGEAKAVLDLEVASQNRVTLVSWLESFISSSE